MIDPRIEQNRKDFDEEYRERLEDTAKGKRVYAIYQQWAWGLPWERLSDDQRRAWCRIGSFIKEKI